jgi:hypothetical protein
VAWFITIVIVAAILIILFLNRYYRKATREVALIRTGAGGQRVVLDGGCLSLPFLHKVSEVNMRTTKLEIERLGPKSIITRDRLRVDVAGEFYVRVMSTVGASPPPRRRWGRSPSGRRNWPRRWKASSPTPCCRSRRRGRWTSCRTTARATRAR